MVSGCGVVDDKYLRRHHTRQQWTVVPFADFTILLVQLIEVDATTAADARDGDEGVLACFASDDLVDSGQEG